MKHIQPPRVLLIVYIQGVIVTNYVAAVHVGSYNDPLTYPSPCSEPTDRTLCTRHHLFNVHGSHKALRESQCEGQPPVRPRSPIDALSSRPMVFLGSRPGRTGYKLATKGTKE